MEYTCTITKPTEILDLIARCPGELSFVVDSDTYQDYLETYQTLEDYGEDFEIVYNEEEFNKIKLYFKGAEKCIVKN